MKTKNLLMLMMIFTTVAISSVRAHASDFIEGIAASVLLSTGMDVTSDGSNEAKRMQIEQLRTDAAEFYLRETDVPSPALNNVLTEMRKKIATEHPEIDLSKLDNRDLAKGVFSDIPMKNQ